MSEVIAAYSSYWVYGPNSGNYGDTTVMSDGYGVLNVRIKFCQLEESGQHRNKRYKTVVCPVQSTLPISSDVSFEASAYDTLRAGETKSVTKRFDTGDDYAPNTERDVVIIRNRTNFISNDIYLGMIVGPTYSAGYVPFKIYRPLLAYRLLGL